MVLLSRERGRRMGHPNYFDNVLIGGAGAEGFKFRYRVWNHVPPSSQWTDNDWGHIRLQLEATLERVEKERSEWFDEHRATGISLDNPELQRLNQDIEDMKADNEELKKIVAHRRAIGLTGGAVETRAMRLAREEQERLAQQEEEQRRNAWEQYRLRVNDVHTARAEAQSAHRRQQQQLQQQQAFQQALIAHAQAQGWI
jgi:hypothetical protein